MNVNLNNFFFNEIKRIPFFSGGISPESMFASESRRQRGSFKWELDSVLYFKISFLIVIIKDLIKSEPSINQLKNCSLNYR